MSYRKDQGRYARMVAFWTLILLIGYGCFHGGGLVNVLDGMLGDSNPTYVQQFPLFGTLKLSTVISIAVLAACAWLVHRVLAKPRIADALINTEGEMTKVTWPAWGETWQGTLAVAATVGVLFLFLTGVDLLLAWVIKTFIV